MRSNEVDDATAAATFSKNIRVIPLDVERMEYEYVFELYCRCCVVVVVVVMPVFTRTVRIKIVVYGVILS